MKKSIKLLITVIVTAVLALCLSGCGRDEISIDGLYVATFELNGGTLTTSSSSVSDKINFAYHPGTYLRDPLDKEGMNYEISRPDYEFTGWYTDPSCSESSKWDFANSVINTEKLTLYAGWQKAVKLTYTLYYTDETSNQLVALDSYRVQSGGKFDDWREIAKGRDNYTPLGYFSDPECQIPWDFNYSHPGLDADLDVRVYVKYMEGEWTFVNTLSELRSAVSKNENVHLAADIDCLGAEVSFNNYSGEFNGNGHTVSNFKVVKSGSLRVSCAIFNKLDDGAVIRDVSFSGVLYDITGVRTNPSAMKVAALAVSSGSITVSNVVVSGQIITNYTGEFTKADDYVYETDENDTVQVSGGSVNLTIVNDN